MLMICCNGKYEMFCSVSVTLVHSHNFIRNRCNITSVARYLQIQLPNYKNQNIQGIGDEKNCAFYAPMENKLPVWP